MTDNAKADNSTEVITAVKRFSRQAQAVVTTSYAIVKKLFFHLTKLSKVKPRNSYRRERLSTIDLLIPTILDQLLLILQTLVTIFYKKAT